MWDKDAGELTAKAKAKRKIFEGILLSGLLESDSTFSHQRSEHDIGKLSKIIAFLSLHRFKVH